jgi:hypothetical protein
MGLSASFLIARANPRSSPATTPLQRSVAMMAPGRGVLGAREQRQQVLRLRLGEVAPLEQAFEMFTQRRHEAFP